MSAENAPFILAGGVAALIGVLLLMPVLTEWAVQWCRNR